MWRISRAAYIIIARMHTFLNIFGKSRPQKIYLSRLQNGQQRTGDYLPYGMLEAQL